MKRLFLALLASTAFFSLIAGPGTPLHAQHDPPSAAVEPPPVRPLYTGLEVAPRLPAAAGREVVQPQVAAPTALPAWARLVYQSARNENDWEIYIADADGANATSISSHHKMDIQPRLNRGATRVAFASDRTGDDFEIYSMAADGSGLTRLTDNESDDGSPAWSPDGTRIVFQAYRDGQPEIYVMAANGSSQTRLTNSPDFDGMPVWSPHGSQIAFTSRRDGQYRIWVMAADGSNQRQVSSQPYSANPAWSPDGSQIAFDADGNSDGWQELWLMNADGSNQHPVYDPPEAYTDAWARSWSPDGEAIAFTQVSYVPYQGNWYWSAATMHYWTSAQPWYPSRVAGSDADWNPGWEAVDAQAPVSAVQTLPAQSPGPFTVHWSGSDVGPAGLKSFDIQVKEGNGAWTNWQTATTATSASYPGGGGRTYTFRARALDNAWNVESWPANPDTVTTVEALPPVSKVAPLPPLARNGVEVSWAGADPGGSGIQSYDVQYRSGSGDAWTGWKMNTTDTSATFFGSGGEQVSFRARALDRAGNQEAWPAGAGQAQVRLYNWAIGGHVMSNRGAPLAAVQVSTHPSPLTGAASQVSGDFQAYVGPQAAAYTAGWSLSGYAALPITAFSGRGDEQIDLALPPDDNRVQDWGFEAGALAAPWQPSGTVQPNASASVRHTGAFAAQMGCDLVEFAPDVLLSNGDMVSTAPALTTDAAGAAHVVWEFHGQGIAYRRRSPEGVWSATVILPGATNGYRPKLAVDRIGAVHVVYLGGASDVYYSLRSPQGVWSSPEAVAVLPDGWSDELELAVDHQGAVHVVWKEYVTTEWYLVVYYNRRAPGGGWGTPTQVSPRSLGGAAEPQILVSLDGVAHIVWFDSGPNQYAVYHAWRQSNGAWTAPHRLSDPSQTAWYPDADLATNGDLHIAWTAFTAGGHATVQYAQRTASGAWLPVVTVTPPPAQANGPRLAVDSVGAAHLIWLDQANDESRLLYIRRNSNGSWTPGESVTDKRAWLRDIAVDEQDRVHVIWSGEQALLSYAWLGQDGVWSTPQTTTHPAQDRITELPQLAVTPQGQAHLVWQLPVPDNSDIYYAGPQLASSPVNSTLRQSIDLPADLTNPTLSFWRLLTNLSGDDSTSFAVKVITISGTVPLLATQSNTAGWEYIWFDLAPWAGQRVTLSFELSQPAGMTCASAHLDEITVGSAYADVWVSSPERAARPGQTLTYPIHYGNQSGAPASGVVISQTLPTDLTFVSASPPPVATTPTLRWELGDLTAESGPSVIMVTAALAGSAAPGIVLTSTVSIAAAAPEIELANNAVAARAWVGGRDYLPLLLR